MVVLLNPDTCSDVPIVELLGDTIRTGARKLFTVVDHEKLLLEVKKYLICNYYYYLSLFQLYIQDGHFSSNVNC